MAYPDFSEFTFGYAVTRQLEEELGARVAVPNFPTQGQEADLGYDVDFLSYGMPVFLQFKRSSVIKRSDCKEFQSPHFRYLFEHIRPFFRMSLHEKNGYYQHYLLRVFEFFLGGCVFYCTSSVQNKHQLDQCYRNGRIEEATTLFSPLSINLPDLRGGHHVSFHARYPFAYLFSDNGIPFDKGFENGPRLSTLRRNAVEEDQEQVMNRMKRLVHAIDTLGVDNLAQGQRLRSYDMVTGSQAAAREIVGSWTPVSPDDLYFPPPSDELRKFLPQIDRRSYRAGRLPQFNNSVVKRLAFEAYFELDAYLLSIPQR